MILAATHQVEAAGDPEAGERVFRACAACHTLAPGEHRTGPSLAGVFGRKAGTAKGFHRYSEALGSADLVWREDTLDAFLADPRGFVPGNRMTFAGIEDAQARADLIAYLQTATAAGAQAEAPDQGGMMATPDLTRSAPRRRAEQPGHLDPLLRRHLYGWRRKRANPTRSGNSTCASRPIPLTKARSPGIPS